MRRRIQKLDGESLYRSSQIRELGEQLEQRIGVLGRFVALASQGRRLTEEQVLEDRLFDDVDATRAGELIAREGTLVVDVREPHEYGVRSHTRRPAGTGQPDRGSLEDIPRDKTVIVYCSSGGRSDLPVDS